MGKLVRCAFLLLCVAGMVKCMPNYPDYGHDGYSGKNNHGYADHGHRGNADNGPHGYADNGPHGNIGKDRYGYQFQVSDAHQDSLYSCLSMDYYACYPEPFTGHNIICLPFSDVCDGFANCPLADDEKYCDQDKINPTPVTSTVTSTKSVTVTSVQVETSTNTETTTITPTVCAVSDSSLFSTQITSRVIRVVTSSYSNDAILPSGETICFTRTTSHPAGESAFGCGSTVSGVFSVSASSALECSATTKLP